MFLDMINIKCYGCAVYFPNYESCKWHEVRQISLDFFVDQRLSLSITVDGYHGGVSDKISHKFTQIFM